MLFDPENSNHLKPWLVRSLEPICDAEPGALGDYILALLKHNAPESELRQELSAQLEEFLEKETSSFVDTLFTALRTRSYLPYSAPSPSSGFASSSTHPMDTGIPIPLDGLLSGAASTSPNQRRKRSVEHDDMDAHAPAKGPRLNHDSQFSRYGRGDGRSSWGGRGGRMGMNGRADFMDGGMNGAMDPGMNGMGMNGRGQYQAPLQRGICRDYHNNGYCARGAYCKYSHGDDAVIPSQLFPMAAGMPGAMPFLPMLANGAMGFGADTAAYNPHERMDMRPPGVGGSRPLNARAPLLPRHGDANGVQKPGELPVIQDLTPQDPEQRPSRNIPQANGSQGPEADGYDATGEQMGGGGMMNGMGMQMGYSQDVEMGAPGMAMGHMRRGGHRGGGRQGTFGGDVQSFRPEKRQGKTLVVEKIPEDKLSLGSVNEWFKRFGTVTNVAVDPHTSKALVTFSDHKEAHAAWKSEDAVFNNRFVKVFWHRPMEGHGQLGKQMLAASASLVSNIAAKEAAVGAAPATPGADTSSAAPSAPSAPHARKPSTSSTAASNLAVKQRLLEQQIAEQKSLMAQLSTTSGQGKKDIMARLRKLNEEMKPTSQPSPSPAVQSPLARAGPAAAALRPKAPTPRSEDHERVERERLDKELELHSAVAAVEGEQEESTEDLQAKLAKLKAEAASLGLSEFAGAPPLGTSSYRPYRGRGRGGRNYYRGAARGGPPRASMKLDNRPRKLVVKGVNSDSVQALRDWYETTGQVESAETLDSGDVLVSFKSRAGAEQGFAKGSKVPIVGQVQVSWYTNQPSTIAPSAHRGTPSALEDTSGVSDRATIAESEAGSSSMIEPEDSHQETDVGGWGGDDAEDGFGML